MTNLTNVSGHANIRDEQLHCSGGRLAPGPSAGYTMDTDGSACVPAQEGQASRLRNDARIDGVTNQRRGCVSAYLRRHGMEAQL